MKIASLFSLPAARRDDPRPRDDELDLFGLTHTGRVRTENQDHFLLATVQPQVVVHATSLPDLSALAPSPDRLATVLLVADGVGGTAAGSVASRLATEAVARCVATAMRCYHGAESPDESGFIEALRGAALGAHEAVKHESTAVQDGRSMATTLSLAVVVWPWLYVIQVGDSRCYVYRGGELRQITRDQTVAQDLVEQGVLPRDRAKHSPLGHMLSSAIGASEARPEITRVDVRERGSVILVCTDGLTRHVSDAEIAAHLGRMTSSEQVCHALLDLALERGGRDNITLVVGRALRVGAERPAPDAR